MRSIHLNLSTATKRDKFIGIAFFGLTIYFLVRSFILSWSIDIWYDELFSMEFSSSSVKELVAYTARDVHPPLYYMIVRFFTLLFKGFGLTSLAGGGLMPIETVAKIVSVIPFILLIIYSLTNIRKHFGWLTAGLFCFAVVTMPGLPEYTTEIRMYSWAIFFVTATLLHGFNLVRSMGNPKGKQAESKHPQKDETGALVSPRMREIINGAAMFIYAVCASYTHYYAAISIGAIYFLLLVWMVKAFILQKSVYNFRPLAILIITMNLVIVAFIPWASALLTQVNAVSNNYWIQPVGLHTLGSCAKYMLSGYFVNPKAAAASAVILALLITIIFALMIVKLIGVKKSMTEEGSDNRAMVNTPFAYSYVAFWVLPMLIAVGFAASIIIRPVFVNRYMVPSFGVFWLAVSIGIGVLVRDFSFTRLREKKSLIALPAVILAIVILIIGIVDFRAFIGNEKYRIVNMTKTAELLGGIDDDTVIISNFDHVQALLSYYLNENGIPGAYKGDTQVPYSIYLYKAEPEQLIKENVPGLYSIEDSADIYNYLDAGKKVLFLGSFNSREVLLDEWNKDYGITYENKGSYLMERYWFDVFELSIQR